MLINEPFFILGNPRSGTSLLRLMLNSHPNIVVPPESGFLQWWYEKHKAITKEEFLDENFISEFVRDILSSKKIEDWELQYDSLITLINKNKPSNYADICSLVYYLYGRNHNKKDFIIGDKNNYYISHTETINTIYPNAKYVHLIRDGRDVACSYIKVGELKTQSKYKPILPTDIDKIAKEWSSNIKMIDKFIKKVPSIKIRYEDLILFPETTLKTITQFLSIDYSNKMLNFYLDKNNDEPTSTIDWKLKTKQPIDKTNLDKYKQILTKEEISIFKSIAGSILKQNGYE